MKTKARQIMELLNNDPTMTDKQVARRANCVPSYVNTLRRKMVHVEPCPEGAESGTPDEGLGVRSPLTVQVGGSHYKDMVIQPVTFIMANEIPFAEGCVIKYVSRWRSKGGVEDLKKARHFLDMLIKHEKKEG